MPDIRETLAELDRRLADLRHRLNGLVTEPEPTPPPPPPARGPVTVPTAAELVSAYYERPPEPDARPSQVEVASEAVGQLGAQIKQLLTIRERLLNDAEQLLAGYERQLRELEALNVAEVEAALAALATPAASQAGRVPARPAYFEGLMTVNVMGVGRIQTIQVLEDSLSRVRQVERVYIRRWHAGHLLLELTLSGGVELIGELNRVLPFPFAVQSATEQEIAITLEGER